MNVLIGLYTVDRLLGYYAVNTFEIKLLSYQ